MVNMPQHSMAAFASVLVLWTMSPYLNCNSVNALKQVKDSDFFNRGYKNVVFTGHVYRRIPTGRRMQCAALCSRDALTCRSFNYFSASKICELNDAAVFSDPQDLKTAEGCSYYEKITATEANNSELPTMAPSTATEEVTSSALPTSTVPSTTEGQVNSEAPSTIPVTSQQVISTAPPSSRTPVASTTKALVTVNPYCENDDDGKHFSDPNDCGKFFQCSHNVMYSKNCTAGLYFSQVKQVCDWPANVNCPT